MKGRSWSIFELDSLIPYELEIYYYLAVKDYKEEKGVK
jgi:hypothetical protein